MGGLETSDCATRTRSRWPWQIPSEFSGPRESCEVSRQFTRPGKPVHSAFRSVCCKTPDSSAPAKSRDYSECQEDGKSRFRRSHSMWGPYQLRRSNGRSEKSWSEVRPEDLDKHSWW